MLVEGQSKKNENFMTGRTGQNRITNFMGSEDLTGQVVKVEIKEGLQNSIRGELVV